MPLRRGWTSGVTHDKARQGTGAASVWRPSLPVCSYSLPGLSLFSVGTVGGESSASPTAPGPGRAPRPSVSSRFTAGAAGSRVTLKVAVSKSWVGDALTRLWR